MKTSISPFNQVKFLVQNIDNEGKWRDTTRCMVSESNTNPVANPFVPTNPMPNGSPNKSLYDVWAKSNCAVVPAMVGVTAGFPIRNLLPTMIQKNVSCLEAVRQITENWARPRNLFRGYSNIISVVPAQLYLKVLAYNFVTQGESDPEAMKQLFGVLASACLDTLSMGRAEYYAVRKQAGLSQIPFAFSRLPAAFPRDVSMAGIMHLGPWAVRKGFDIPNTLQGDIVSAVLAMLTGQLLTTPQDAVKTQMFLSEKPIGFIKAIEQLYKAGGLSIFYKNLVPRFGYLGIQMVCLYTGTNLVAQYFGLDQKN